MIEISYQGMKVESYVVGEIIKKPIDVGTMLYNSQSAAIYRWDGYDWRLLNSDLTIDQREELFLRKTGVPKKVPEDPAVDDPAAAAIKIQAFEETINSLQTPVIWNVKEGYTAELYSSNGNFETITGTYFEYVPDRLISWEEENAAGTKHRITTAWACTGHSASMQRCIDTCSPERWKNILKALNYNV